MSNSNKKLRLELLVAGPPTRKCKQLIEMMKSFMAEFPDKLQLDIYYAGERTTGNPTTGFKKETGKIRKIPSAYINGINVASKEVPEKEKIRKILTEELNKPENEWQE